MNTRIFPFLLCLLLALTGCYEDESNDRLLPKATVSVTGIAESYTVGALKEVSLDITPDVVSPGNEHRAWWGIVSEKDRYNAVIDTLARTVELHIRRSFLPGEYILLYYVEDVSTGLSHMLKTRLSARTEFSKGWWVQKTTPDGTGCDIDMFPDEGSLIPDVIRNAAGQALEGKAVDMTTAQYSFSYTTTDASGTPAREQAAPLIVASARELAVLTVLLLADELLKDVSSLATGQFVWAFLPFHLCSINLFICVWYALRPNDLAAEVLYALCLPGAAAALLFPSWQAVPLWNVMHLHSSTVHTMLVLFPVLLLAGGFRPDVRRLPKVFGVFCLDVLAAALVNHLCGTNFMFLRGSYGNAALGLIEQVFGTGPGYLAGMMLLVLLVWTALYTPWVLAGWRSKKGR